MQAILSDLISSIMEFPSAIGEVAAQSPITAVLVGMGALLIGLSVAVFGYLSLGAAVDLVTPH